MDAPQQFNIRIKRHIPYLSKVFLWAAVAFLLILGLGYFLMSPAKYASDEMQTAYFTLVLPDIIKDILGVSALGLLVSAILYRFAKITRPALLTMNSKSLLIHGKGVHIEIPFKRIRKIHFNDLTDIFRNPRYKTEIAINQLNKKHTVFRLADYADSDSALTMLSNIPDIEFLFNEKTMEAANDED